MITTQDLYNILGNKISNEMQKSLIRNNFPLQIAKLMCDAIDGQEKKEHFIRFLDEYNEWMVQQQMVVQEFLRWNIRSRKGRRTKNIIINEELLVIL